MFIHSFKKIADTISKLDRPEDFTVCVGKFGDYLRKNIKNFEQHLASHPLDDHEFQFDLKFELSQLAALKQKNTELESRVWKAKE